MRGYVGRMKNLSWAAYGLGVAVVVFALMGGELGVVGKTLLVAGTIFIGAVIAAINNVAEALVVRREESSDRVSVESRSPA